MTRYRTEVDVPPDRYVCLQLPSHFQTGRATVIVLVQVADEGEDLPHNAPPETDDDDVEWWEEFDDEPEAVG